jgi:hypothetical protein
VVITVPVDMWQVLMGAVSSLLSAPIVLMLAVVLRRWALAPVRTPALKSYEVRPCWWW